MLTAAIYYREKIHSKKNKGKGTRNQPHAPRGPRAVESQGHVRSTMCWAAPHSQPEVPVQPGHIGVLRQAGTEIPHCQKDGRCSA